MDKISTIFLAGSLIIIMLGMGLSLQATDFKRILVYPKAIFVGLINQLILLPLIGFALVKMFPVNPEIAIGIMILAACPGGPTSNLITHLAKGDLALSVTLTALSSLITIITIPFIINFALVHFLSEGQMIRLNVMETVIQIFVIIVIPVVIGMLIRRFRENFAERMARPVRIASAIVIALVIIGVVIKENDKIISYFRQAGLISLTLNAITMMVGYYSSRLLRLKTAQAISISVESGIQNGTLAISIAVVLLGNTAFSIAPVIYSLIMFFTSGVIVYTGIKQTRAVLAS